MAVSKIKKQIIPFVLLFTVKIGFSGILPLQSTFMFYGFSLFSEYLRGPVGTAPYYYLTMNSDSTITAIPTDRYMGSGIQGFGIISGTFNMRSTFKEYKTAVNQSLSLCTPITIGFPYGKAGNLMKHTKCSGYANFAVFLEYNLGLAATSRVSDERGFMIGVGWEGFLFPFFFSDRKYTNQLGEQKKFKFYRLWTQPVMHFSYKYKNKQNKMKELNFKFGMGQTDSYVNEKGENIKDRTMAAKLSYMIYI